MKQILVVSLSVFASHSLRELLHSRVVSVAPSVEKGSNLLGRGSFRALPGLEERESYTDVGRRREGRMARALQTTGLRDNPLNDSVRAGNGNRVARLVRRLQRSLPASGREQASRPGGTKVFQRAK
jgi:hypothetical protein